MCKCGKAHQTFGIRFELLAREKWKMTWAFPIKESAGKREGYDKTAVSGEILMATDYPGCPCCGEKNFTRCDCGHISCTIIHGDIFTCEWCGAQGHIVPYSGEKITASMDG